MHKLQCGGIKGKRIDRIQYFLSDHTSIDCHKSGCLLAREIVKIRESQGKWLILSPLQTNCSRNEKKSRTKKQGDHDDPQGNHRMAAILGSSIADTGFREECLIIIFLIIDFPQDEIIFLNLDHFDITQIMAAILDFGL